MKNFINISSGVFKGAAKGFLAGTSFAIPAVFFAEGVSHKANKTDSVGGEVMAMTMTFTAALGVPTGTAMGAMYGFFKAQPWVDRNGMLKIAGHAGRAAPLALTALGAYELGKRL